jgi:EAL domain-containing protein (putative c-di-GMP-specific phosphodiesterase class I)
VLLNTRMARSAASVNVQSVVALAKALHLDVTGEGIETSGQQAQLARGLPAPLPRLLLPLRQEW